MGGFGSGGWYRWDTKPKLDSGLRLDINKLIRDGLIPKGSGSSMGTLTWTRTRDNSYVASIGYTVFKSEDSAHMQLRYTKTIHDEPHDLNYRVDLTTTRTNYGQRYWFVCPVTGRRAAVLYSAGGSRYFASRHAYRLKYRSQGKSAQDRAIDRMWKLKNRLGGDDYYIKPKGMHQRTFERKLDEVYEAEEVCDAYLAKHMMFFMERVKSLPSQKS